MAYHFREVVFASAFSVPLPHYGGGEMTIPFAAK
jgi:hypothetical protein